MRKSPSNKIPATSRFWAKVKMTETCWLWTGYRNAKGYGNFAVSPGDVVLTHRWAYEQAIGPIPIGACVLHTCDHPACVYHGHLFLGTIADNNADMKAKGRHQRGETNGFSKLTSAAVEAIRAATGRQSEIATQFGVHQATVSRVRNRRIWQEDGAS